MSKNTYYNILKSIAKTNNSQYFLQNKADIINNLKNENLEKNAGRVYSGFLNVARNPYNKINDKEIADIAEQIKAYKATTGIDLTNEIQKTSNQSLMDNVNKQLDNFLTTTAMKIHDNKSLVKNLAKLEADVRILTKRQEYFDKLELSNLRHNQNIELENIKNINKIDLDSKLTANKIALDEKKRINILDVETAKQINRDKERHHKEILLEKQFYQRSQLLEKQHSNRKELLKIKEENKKRANEEKEKERRKQHKQRMLLAVSGAIARGLIGYADPYWHSSAMGKGMETAETFAWGFASPYTTQSALKKDIMAQLHSREAYLATGQMNPLEIALGIHPMMSDSEKIKKVKKAVKNPSAQNYFLRELNLLSQTKANYSPNGEEQGLIERIIGAGTSIGTGAIRYSILDSILGGFTGGALGGLGSSLIKKGVSGAGGIAKSGINSLKKGTSKTIGLLGKASSSKLFGGVSGVINAYNAYESYNKGNTASAIGSAIDVGLGFMPFLPIKIMGGLGVGGKIGEWVDDNIINNNIKQTPQELNKSVAIQLTTNDDMFEKKMIEISEKVFDRKTTEMKLNGI